jgi:hypothetical protein
MTDDRLQPQRFERKYILSEPQALKVREFVRAYLVADEHSRGRENWSYPVHSLYLDSDHLATYWATVHCEKSRFKLRLRYYDNDPDSPVFFEIKRRMNECILKQRGAIRKSAAALLVAGHFPEPGHLLAHKPSHLVAVQKFCLLMHELSARPKMHVAYEREAWVHPDSDAVRVTLDRAVRGEETKRVRLATAMERPYFPFGDKVVLELKFTNRFPDWFGDLVRHFNLTQCGAPKYCGSVLGVGEERLSSGGDGPPPRLAGLTKYF